MSTRRRILSLADKAQAIIQGYGNWIFQDPEVEAVARQRVDICLACPHIRYLWKRNTLTSKCGKCKCSIPAKARSTSGCPLGKWPEFPPEKPKE